MQRFWLSGLLAHRFFLFSSGEEERLFEHSCSECYLLLGGLALVLLVVHCIAWPRRLRLQAKTKNVASWLQCAGDVEEHRSRSCDAGQRCCRASRPCSTRPASCKQSQELAHWRWQGRRGKQCTSHARQKLHTASTTQIVTIRRDRWVGQTSANSKLHCRTPQETAELVLELRLLCQKLPRTHCEVTNSRSQSTRVTFVDGTRVRILCYQSAVLTSVPSRERRCWRPSVGQEMQALTCVSCSEKKRAAWQCIPRLVCGQTKEWH